MSDKASASVIEDSASENNKISLFFWQHPELGRSRSSARNKPDYPTASGTEIEAEDGFHGLGFGVPIEAMKLKDSLQECAEEFRKKHLAFSFQRA